MAQPLSTEKYGNKHFSLFLNNIIILLLPFKCFPFLTDAHKYETCTSNKSSISLTLEMTTDSKFLKIYLFSFKIRWTLKGN